MTAKQPMDDYRYVVAVFIALIISQVANVTWLLSMLDYASFAISLDKNWLESFRHAASIVAGYSVLRLVRRKNSLEEFSSPLKVFIAVSAVGLLVSMMNALDWHKHVNSLVFQIINATSSEIISCFISFALFFIASVVKKSNQSAFSGYRRPLLVGLYAAAVFSLLVVFKTPIALSLIFTNAVVLIILAASSERFNFLDISNRKYIRIGVISIGLFVPFVAYGKTPLLIIGAFGELIGDVIVTVASNDDNHSVTTPQSGADDLETAPLKIMPIFNDQWLFNDQDRLAVRGKELMRSNDGGVTWNKERTLSFDGDAIHFDQSGKRGWVGNRYIGIETTEDGGKTWSKLTPESAYRRAMGKKYQSGLFDTISELYLNPETGEGSFTAKCFYFFTDDFAKTWKRQGLANKEGDRACLVDSPFSMNESLGLALVRETLFEQMYQYNESTNTWGAVCDLPGGELGTKYCSENDSLSEAEKRFAAQDWNEPYFHDGTRPMERTRDTILQFGEQEVASMLKKPKITGNTHWFADEGYLVTSNDNGQSWNIEQDIRTFDNILPVTTSTGFGWNAGDSLWISRNSGSAWARYFTDEASPPFSIEITANGEYLWLLYPDKLTRIHTETEQAMQVQSWDVPAYTHLESAGNGAVLWAYRKGGESTTISFDAGETWHDFRAGKAQRTQSGGWSIAAIEGMYCMTDSPSCFLLRTDGTLSEIALEAGVLQLVGPDKILLPTIEDDDYEDSYDDIVVNSSGQNMLAVPYTSRYVYVSNDRGKSWTRTSMGSENEYRESAIEVSGDGNTLAINRDRGLSISKDFGRNWTLVKLDNDDYSNRKLCWSFDAKTMFLYDDEYLAVSTDRGTEWTEYDGEYLDETWCGIGNDLVWLKKQDIEISAVGQNNE